MTKGSGLHSVWCIDMAEYRRFFADISEKQGDKIVLVKDYNHIARVLRMRAGDQVFVCFNDGMEHFCTITNIDSNAVYLDIVNSWQSQAENNYKVTLYMGIMKGDKNDFVVQKAVELGVNEIVFFESKYTVSKIDDKKADRLNKISLEASKQCGRAVAVSVKHFSFAQLVKEIASYQGKALLCYEREQDNSIIKAVSSEHKDYALIIGSEGGFHPDECQKLIDAGAVSVSLGKRILRAETAPLYALSVIDCKMAEGE